MSIINIIYRENLCVEYYFPVCMNFVFVVEERIECCIMRGELQMGPNWCLEEDLKLFVCLCLYLRCSSLKLSWLFSKILFVVGGSIDIFKYIVIQTCQEVVFSNPVVSFLPDNVKLR